MSASPIERQPDRIARGIALILCSTFIAASQDTLLKYASADLTLWQICLLRSLFLIPALLAIACFWGEGIKAWREALRFWPMMRALMFVGMYLAVYAAISVLPLSTLAAGMYTAPLFVAALSALLTGEPAGVRGWTAIAIGFAGVLLILRPGTEAFSWAMLLPILAGLFYALSALLTRSKCREVPPSTLAISLAIALLAVGALGSAAINLVKPSAMLIENSPFLFGAWGAIGATEWALIAILAGLMAANGLVVPAAYQSAPSATIATFDYAYLIFATAMGFVVFRETPDLWTVLGMVTIVGAGLLVARR